MKTTKPAVILLALVLLLTTATAQSAEKPEKKEISNTRTASCLFKITTNEAVLPLNEFAVDYLLRSSGVAGKAAREVLNLSPDEASELFTCEEIYSIDTGPYGGIGGGTGGIGIPPGTTVPARTSPTAVRSPRPAATSTSRTARRTPTTPTRTPTRPTTTTAKTRIPAFPGGAVSGYDDYYRKPKPTSGRSTRTTTNPPPSATEYIILFHLHVDLSEAISNDEPIKIAAEEFMNALIENLRSALSGAFKQHNNKLNNQLHLAAEEVERAEVDLINMQNELRNISDSRDLFRYAINREISTLRQQLQSARMQLASDEVLYEETAKRIATTEAKRKAMAVNDPITRELKSILDVHEKRLKEIQRLYDKGNASAADIQDVKEKIIRARIELAQRREQIINPPGRIEMSSLNDELANLSTKVTLAQQEKRSLEEQLEEAKDLLRKADVYELFSLKADIAKQNLEETLLWRARLGRNIRSIQPPDVTVIGAE